jgi:uncharacterized protein (TIGR03790 family)
VKQKSFFPPARLLPAALLLITLLFRTAPTLALEPDQILLITNKNVPDSQRLAQIYCQLRNVPANRICQLDLPSDEEMPFATYETAVVAPVRQFIIDNHLQGQITCLLTFYGVPYRVADKINTPAELTELAGLMDQQKTLTAQAEPVVEGIEKQAAELDSQFTPGTGQSLGELIHRELLAGQAVAVKVAAMTDLNAQTQATGRLMQLVTKLGGLAELDARLGAQQRSMPGKSDADRASWFHLHDQVLQALQLMQQYQALRWDADARAKLRDTALQTFGIFGGLRIVDAQIAYFQTDHTASATDSELALLWWDYYPRQNWQINPRYLHITSPAPPSLMVMRLDAPTPDVVEKMMRTSVQVEQTGLQGIFAIDARGLPPTDAFGQFDQTLRNLATLVRTKTAMKIRLGDEDLVFPPHTVKNVALYCGWYSVGHYIPGCDFNPGAVGFHIASYEMVHLHTDSNEWVRGLLNDGVVATLGPVAEPYLGAFPNPDEFFPLLLTGKLPLAEVYWKTTPMTSWMISCIGDPLYTPYKLNPPLKVEDLPAPLQAAIPPAVDSSPTPR